MPAFGRVSGVLDGKSHMHARFIRPVQLFALVGWSAVMFGSARAHASYPRRILIVEDDYLVALQFENALTEAGYDVVDIASTAAEAVQMVPDHQPELVLMDIRLAGPRDGIDAAAEIFDRFGVRSIFVSAFTDPATQTRAQPARPLAWLSKPVSDHKLVAAVDTALRQIEGRSACG
jgi:DNA-binding NarL/FixJ family response regulator